jgi:hypothetical protein
MRQIASRAFAMDSPRRAKRSCRSPKIRGKPPQRRNERAKIVEAHQACNALWSAARMRIKAGDAPDLLAAI